MLLPHVGACIPKTGPLPLKPRRPAGAVFSTPTGAYPIRAVSSSGSVAVTATTAASVRLAITLMHIAGFILSSPPV